MNLSNLEKTLEGEKKYRLKQANEAIYKKLISDWEEATFFAKDLRDKLNKECPLGIKADVLVSKKPFDSAQGGGNCVKAKITLQDGFQIETVLMRHGDGRNTVCVSCQVGCPLGCLFCATGKMGLKRSLTTEEILEQVIFFDRYLNAEVVRDPRSIQLDRPRVSNVTFMGMGEPFLNYDNVWGAVKILNDAKLFNIGVRSISISTAGIVEGIKRLSDEPLHVNLAISLHAPNNKLRSQLMPISRKYSLEKVIEAVDDYIEKTKRKVMFEYVLIKDVNDTNECAKELAELMKKKLYFVNLILYNATGVFKPSDQERVERFRAILEKAKVRYTQRYRFGDDIQAACGQFATGKN